MFNRRPFPSRGLFDQVATTEVNVNGTLLVLVAAVRGGEGGVCVVVGVRGDARNTAKY